MARWLFKQEPGCYAYADLERDGETVWDGVTNPLALIHLRAAKVDDRVFFYHTGSEKAVVGMMEITGREEADGKPLLTVRPLGRLANPVTLAAIKADPAFVNWELVKNSRLSVMPVPEAVWKRIEKLAAGAPPAKGETMKGKTKKTAG